MKRARTTSWTRNTMRAWVLAAGNAANEANLAAFFSSVPSFPCASLSLSIFSFHTHIYTYILSSRATLIREYPRSPTLFLSSGRAGGVSCRGRTRMSCASNPDLA